MLSVGTKLPHFYYVMFLPLISIFRGLETVALRQFLKVARLDFLGGILPKFEH